MSLKFRYNEVFLWTPTNGICSYYDVCILQRRCRRCRFYLFRKKCIFRIIERRNKYSWIPQPQNFLRRLHVLFQRNHQGTILDDKVITQLYWANLGVVACECLKQNKGMCFKILLWRFLRTWGKVWNRNWTRHPGKPPLAHDVRKSSCVNICENHFDIVINSRFACRLSTKKLKQFIISVEDNRTQELEVW